MKAQLNYGNWVRRRILLILGISALGAAVLSLLPFGSLYQLVMAVLAVMTFISFLLPLYSYVMFSQHGGQIQDRVYNLIIQRLGLPIAGRIIDIGSGNGVLAVKLAQQYDGCEIVGTDYWGKNWEYSKEICDENARIGGVANRVHFQKADAAALEFASDTFDGAVSNLTFHEVRSVSDKREVVQEALRVVKRGGKFAFVDYFYDVKHYGAAAEFENYLRSLNLSHFEMRSLREMIALPLVLRHPKVLGQAGIVYGTK